MRKIKNTLCKGIGLLLIGGNILPMQGQRTQEWVTQYDRGEYVEGFYALNISVGLEMISFFNSFQASTPFDVLQFRFFSPTDTSFFLKVAEKNILNYYSLESKPGQLQKNMNRLGPWPIGSLLEEHNIPPSNLGLLLRVGADDSNHFLPLDAFEHNPNAISTSYKAVYRLSHIISRGQFSVYPGRYPGVLPEAKKVQVGRIGRHFSGAVFQIEVGKATLGDYEGWVTVDVSLSQRGKTTKLTDRFFFYHRP